MGWVDNDLDAIKDRLPLADYLSTRIKLTRQGATMVGLCPFHGDSKRGNFTVYPQQDTFHCFGCSAHGDIFDFYQRENSCDFKEALQALAKLAGVEIRHKPEDVAAIEKKRVRGQILSDISRHYCDHLQAEHKEYLKRRGFAEEFVRSYGFGYAPGGTLPNTQELRDLGLVNDQGRDFFWNRLIIPVYGRDGEVVNLIGRALSDDVKPKYLRLPGPAQIINEQGLRKTEVVYLCEGETDTLTLLQAGLPVVGVGGAEGLKAEYAPRFERIKTVYICADGDRAGRDLIVRAGELLGNRCRVIELPEGEDVNSWVGQKGNVLWPNTAKPYLDYLLEKLPSEVDADQLDEIIKPVLAGIASLRKASQDAYLKRLAKRVGISVVAAKEALRELMQAQEVKSEKQFQDDQMLWEDARKLNPAQDYIDGVMYTVAFMDITKTDPETGQRKVETSPYCITSKREMFPLTEAECYKRGLRMVATKVPTLNVIEQRWSRSGDRDYSIKNYVHGETKVDPWAVYQEVVGYFRAYIDYPNDLYYDFLALWTIGTYFFNMFSCYPYVHLTGTKRVGKSLTLRIVEGLGFNSLWSSSMSPAAMYRSVESCSTTLLLDEAENLQKRDKNVPQDDKLEILKAGYGKGAKAIRCAGDNHDPTKYDVYSPKMFGGTNVMERILEDRVISLVLTRKKREVNEFNEETLRPQLARTRDKLYFLMLDHAADIAECIQYGIQWDGVKDRERELWTPILVFALFFDNYRFEEVKDVPAEDLLTVRMRRLAWIKGEEKRAKEQTEHTEVLILEALLDYLKAAEPVHPGWYATGALLAHVQEIEELAWVKNFRQIVQVLERVTIVQNKKRDFDRLHNQFGKKVRVIRLDVARVKDVAERYGAGE